MRIALLSTCAVAVPPRAYGGIEAFVDTLARCLVARGHELVIYATGDSHPPCELCYRFARPIWPIDYRAEREHARFAWQNLRAFDPDVVHCNLPDALQPDLAQDRATVVTVHHERIDSLVPMYRAMPATVVAISRDQARRMPELRVRRVIHHGLEVERFGFGAGDGGYALFLGRIGPEKAPHLAIEAARRAGVPLRIAGPNWHGQARYDAYFRDLFEPALAASGDGVEWVGEVDFDRKLALLRRARALVMPLGWDEPFGLVMIEAMLVGTPVIAFARGSVPEVVDEGVTGRVVEGIEAMADALTSIGAIDRERCREHARRRFGAERMADEYEALYREAARAALPRAAIDAASM